MTKEKQQFEGANKVMTHFVADGTALHHAADVMALSGCSAAGDANVPDAGRSNKLATGATMIRGKLSDAWELLSIVLLLNLVLLEICYVLS